MNTIRTITAVVLIVGLMLVELIRFMNASPPVYPPVVGNRALVQVVIPTNDASPVWPSERSIYDVYGVPTLLSPISVAEKLPEVFGIMKRPVRRDGIATTIAAIAHEQVVFDQKELRCLATNIYHEARGEGRIGMVAVAWTTINRRDSPHFPNTVCGVVYQPSQFAWIKEGHTSINEVAAYNRSMDAARFVYYNHESVTDYTGGSLYFLSPMDNPPSWSRKFATTFKYRKHTFYRPY